VLKEAVLHEIQLEANVIILDFLFFSYLHAKQFVMIELPELTKMYYSIGEVAKMFNVNVSLIRFWSDKFTQLKPKTKKNGARLYTPKDIELIHRIYFLVKVEERSLDAAAKVLRSGNKDQNTTAVDTKELDVAEVIQKLEGIRKKLVDLK
jgi:DNA-binding transcriptional MerR regulator